MSLGVNGIAAGHSVVAAGPQQAGWLQQAGQSSRRCRPAGLAGFMQGLLDPRRWLCRLSAQPVSPGRFPGLRIQPGADAFSQPVTAAMAALIALATAPVWPVTHTVAGPPRIFTAFLYSATRLQNVYIKT